MQRTSPEDMIKPVIFFLVLVFLILQPSCNSKPEKVTQRLVMLDVDVSVDDMMTILYFLACPDVSIKAITIVQGVSGVEEGAEIVLRLLALTGHPEIPVAKGKGKPLKGDNAFPAQWQPPMDHPFGLQLPPHGLSLSRLSAEAMIDSLVTRHPGDITVMALGPMTNLAASLLNNSGLSAKIREIYVSDGAVKVEGGIYREFPAIENRVSGWNLWADARAAETVFQSGTPVVLIPLDLTALHGKDPLILTAHVAAAYRQQATGTIGKSMAVLMDNWLASYVDTQLTDTAVKRAPIWDVVAGMIFHYPAIGVTWHECHADIVQGTDEVAGQIVTSDSGMHNVRVCVAGDQSLLDSLLLVTAGR